MKLLLFLVLVLCLVGPGSALQIVPDLYGFGTETRAAYGATNDPEICIVNSLATTSGDPTWNATGYSVGVYEGTFMQCVDLDTTSGGTIDGHTISANSGKVILFSVSGTIGSASSTAAYNIEHNYTSILGQSAPSPGILLKNCQVWVRTNDVFMQHLRIRGVTDIAKDPIYIGPKPGTTVHNVVFDHGSVSWGLDETFLIGNYADESTSNVSVLNSIIAEGIWHVDEVSKCMAISTHGDYVEQVTNISVINCMLAGSEHRHPQMNSVGVALINNYIYNPGNRGTATIAYNYPVSLSIVGNVVEGGPWSGTYAENYTFSTYASAVYWTYASTSEIYSEDNKCNAGTQSAVNNWDLVDDRPDGDVEADVVVAEKPIWPTGMTAISSADVKTSVLLNAGARPADRDSVDTRLVGEANNGTGVINKSSVESGDWPSLDENNITLSIPSNPHTDSGDGYTNLEVWLHGLADEVEGNTEAAAPTVSDFTYHKIITINQTMVNQSIGTGIYPMLVSTTDTDLRDHAQADGDDIVFFASDNTTLLSYEQEFWNSTTGELVEWVGVTDITNVSYIVMYYNNSTIANSENITGVWDSNFKLVQHLNETPAGTTYDSTSNNNDGTTVNMTSADQVSGQVDGSLDLDGDDHISLTSQAIDNNVAFTISTWMNGTDGDIAYGEGYDGNDNWALFLGIDGSPPYSARFYVKDNNVWKALTKGTTQVNDSYHYVTLSQTNKSHRTIYIDGQPEETTTTTYGDMSTLNTANIGVLERSAFGSYFVGGLDELRVSDTARSAAWIETEYNNTASPELFISIGAEQGAGTPNTKFEYWTGSAWVEDEAQYYLWFSCFWYTPECANAEQSDSQATLKIINNGTASGTPKMKLNESAPSGIRIFIDDDNTFADAVELTNTYQAVSTSLTQDTNITLWAWANLSGAPAWEFETYAIVE